MDRELLAKLGTYSEVYEYVAKGSRTKEGNHELRRMDR